MDYKSLFFTASGRINRGKWWLGLLLIMAVGIAVGILEFILAKVLGVNQSTEAGQFAVSGVASIPFLVLGFGYFVFYLWAAICLNIKRCHDRDRSGWFMLVQLIPLVGQIWYFVEAGCLAGTPGPNRFGPNPLGVTALSNSFA